MFIKFKLYKHVIRTMMDEIVFDEPIRKRGLSIICFAVESVTLDDESSKKYGIKNKGNFCVNCGKAKEVKNV